MCSIKPAGPTRPWTVTATVCVCGCVWTSPLHWIASNIQPRRMKHMMRDHWVRKEPTCYVPTYTKPSSWSWSMVMALMVMALVCCWSTDSQSLCQLPIWNWSLNIQVTPKQKQIRLDQLSRDNPPPLALCILNAPNPWPHNSSTGVDKTRSAAGTVPQKHAEITLTLESAWKLTNK